MEARLCCQGAFPCAPRGLLTLHVRPAAGALGELLPALGGLLVHGPPPALASPPPCARAQRAPPPSLALKRRGGQEAGRGADEGYGEGAQENEDILDKGLEDILGATSDFAEWHDNTVDEQIGRSGDSNFRPIELL